MSWPGGEEPAVAAFPAGPWDPQSAVAYSRNEPAVLCLFPRHGTGVSILSVPNSPGQGFEKLL